jgi:tetratricopeptide (TPR) repeat protein
MNKITAITIILLSCLPAVASAASTRTILEKAQENYKAGNFAEALEIIDQATEKDPDNPYGFYDRGNVLFRQGKYNEAVKSYEQAALPGNDPELTARAYYNMGNAALTQAREEKDGDKSLALLNNSVNSYRNALRLDQSLKDAAHNLELARLAIKQKKEELRQQKQQQCDRQQNNKDQNNEEMKKNLEDMKNRQQQQAEKNKENSQGQNSDQQNQQMAAEQEKLRQDTQKAQQQLSGQQQKETDAAADELQQAMNSQQQAEEELKKNRPGRAAEKQEEAAKHLQQALDSLSGNDNKKDKQQQQQEEKQTPQDKKDKSKDKQQAEDSKQSAGQQQNGVPPADQEESLNQTDKELSPEDILELEKKLRQLRQQQMNRTSQGVEKDW